MKKRLIVASMMFAMAALAGEFKAGFARMDITPPMGTPLAGYYNYRASDGVLDPLEATCVAVSDGTRTALLVTIDHLHLANTLYDAARTAAAKAANVPPEAVYIAATHTHLGPVGGLPRYLDDKSAEERARVKALIDAANAKIVDQIAAAGKAAVSDLAPAEIRLATGSCPGVSFIRRYRMKDGSSRTNPGTTNPDIAHPIGTPDDTVQLVRFVREGKPDIAVVNFQTHPDTIGGTKCSADWPGVLRRTVEKALDGEALVAFFNGAQGDTNHCVYPADSLPPQKKGYSRAVNMGRKLAGTVLGLWGYTWPAESGNVAFKIATVQIPAKPVDPAKLDHYRKVRDLHLQGRRKELVELCGPGMEVTTAVAEALNCLGLAKGKTTSFEMPVSCVTIGHTIAFGGFPGEPFTQLGRTLKEKSKFKMTIPTCTTNGSFGYLPEESAYAEGGYEQRSSRYASGVGERLVQGLLATLDELWSFSF